MDEICGSLLTYEQKVNKIDEEKKKEVIEKKKGIALKMSSKDEELYDNSCEDEDEEMAMLTRRYKKLAFQRDQRIGRRNFRRDRFRNDPSRNNQITCYGCKQPRHLRSECPMNKEGKKYKDKKKKKKVMVATWSDSDSSSFENTPKMKIKANLCLMAIDDEVCLVDFDKLQNEYEFLFDDFEKLRHRCKDYKKIITTLTLDVENTKHEYDVVIDNKNELKKYLEVMKSENEVS